MNHPGTVTYVDGDSLREQVLPVTQVPEAMRFADTDEGPVPVVRVVAQVAGEQRFIREYGPAGQLVRSTVQRRG